MVIQPFISTARSAMSELRKFLDRVEKMHIQNADRIARTKDRVDIMRVVDIFEHDRQRRLTALEGVIDLCSARFGFHKRINARERAFIASPNLCERFSANRQKLSRLQFKQPRRLNDRL